MGLISLFWFVKKLIAALCHTARPLSKTDLREVARPAEMCALENPPAGCH